MKRFRTTRNGKNILVLCLIGLVMCFIGIVVTISGRIPYGLMGLVISILIGALLLMITDKTIEAGSSSTNTL